MMTQSFKNLLVGFPEQVGALVPGPGKLLVRYITPEEKEHVTKDGIILPYNPSTPQDLLKTAIVINANFAGRDAFTMYYADEAKDNRFGPGSVVYLNGLSGVHFQRLDPATTVMSENDMERVYGIISFQEILLVDYSKKYEVNSEGFVVGLDEETLNKDE